MIAAMWLLTLLVLALAWANGANDVAKGVATLAGSGVATPRQVIIWGAVCSVMGGIVALLWGSALVSVFSKGFLSEGTNATLAFSIGAVFAAAAWVLFATQLRLPVSTTHGLVGGIAGAAIGSFGMTGLHAPAIASKALIPLLASPLIAIGLCWLLLLATRYIEKRRPQWSPGCCARADYEQDPFVCVPEGERPSPLARRVWRTLHWLSAGATSFARGLNDVPKMAALLLPVIALAGATSQSAMLPIIAVTIAMGAGSLWGGYRLLPILAQRVTRMDERTGLVANLGTSALVLAASPLGLPVSTTHVSTGALMGVRFGENARPDTDALKIILFAWLVTLPVAAILGYLTSRIAALLMT
jgi:PiT family inorganic phosphate transporter